VSLFTETVTLLAQQVVGEDAYGNDLVDWVQAVSPAWLEQRNSTETLNANEQTTASMLLYLPLAAPLSHPDRVVWDGREWHVSGQPGRQPGGFIVEGYQVVSIERTEG
jgi:hypothetical protein